MAVSIQTEFVDWTELKVIRSIKNDPPFQYIETSKKYTIWIQDGAQRYVVELVIDTSSFEGINVTQNNTDKTDWEDNYKAGARGKDLPDWMIAGEVSVTNTIDANIAGGTIEVDAFSELATSSICKQAEYNLVSRNQTDIPTVSHTVTTGKKFALVWFGASADSPAPVAFRLKVDNTVKMKIFLGASAGGNVESFSISTPIIIANAGETVKISVEPAYKNGEVWASFIGEEVDA
jgi:hypothetical protein